MAVYARDVAAALRERLRGFSQVRAHKLLYLCQGHHLATFGEPLFREGISAWDMGPVITGFWHEQREGAAPLGSASELTEGQLNTVGYVVSRYGRLSDRDLITLSHAQDPWQRANKKRHVWSKRSARIELEWMQEYFGQDVTRDEDEAWPDSGAVRAWLDATAAERAGRPEPRVDTREELLTRLGRA